MENKKYINLLLKMINDIKNNNFKIEFESGRYTYSKEITSIFEILEDDYFKNILKGSRNTHKVRGKVLNNVENSSSLDIVECIIYLDWLWYGDGSGIATGMVYKKIKSGKYTLLLERFKECIENIWNELELKKKIEMF